MRYLNDKEKDLLIKLRDIERKDIPTLLDSDLDGIRILVNMHSREVELRFQLEQAEPSQAELEIFQVRLNKISELIVTLSNVLNLLEKEGYILFFQEAYLPQDEIGFGRADNNRPYISYVFPDKGVTDLFIRFALKQIIFTEEMVWYINNSFITRKEQRHRETIAVANESLSVARKSSKIALISIVVAIIIGVFSIMLGIINSNKTHKFELTKSQMETINENFNNWRNNQIKLHDELVDIGRIIVDLKKDILAIKQSQITKIPANQLNKSTVGK